MDVRVIGLGNVLMGDDGFGPCVVKTLEALYEFPADVSVVDAGTPGLDLSPFLMRADVVILVDAVRADGEPGSVRTYGRDAVMRPGLTPRLGPHDPALAATLHTLDLGGVSPRALLLIGAVVGQVGTGPGLSDEMRRAVPVAIERLVNMLAVLGFTVTPRTPPLEPDLWWERLSKRPGTAGFPASPRGARETS